MGIALDDQAILESAGLAFIGVDGQILHRRILGDEAPFDPCRETGPAAAPQAGGLHLGDHLFGSHGQGLAERLVSAMRQIGADLFRVRPVDVGQQYRLPFRHG